MGPLGSLLGYGPMQQQLQGQQGVWPSLWNASTSNNVTNTYVVSMAPVEAVPVRKPGPETALEWLDRRVAEIRLPLAA